MLPGFNLTLGLNEGSSFAMMSGVRPGTPLLIATLTGRVDFAFAIVAFRERHPADRQGLALVVGGAWQHRR